MFISDKRVIRDGYLVAFAGEEMTEEEAKARGLIDDKPKPKRTTRKKKALKDEAPETDEETEQ